MNYLNFIVRALLTCVFFMGCSVLRTKNRDVETRIKKTFFSARKENELRKRVIILPFTNLSSYPDEKVAGMSQKFFSEQLLKTDHVVYVDGKTFGINDVSEFKKGADYDYQKLAAKLKNSGVHALIVGRVKDLRTGKKGDSVGIFRRVRAEVKAVAEVSVVSVRSGKIMINTVEEASLEEHMTRVAERSFKDDVIKDNDTFVHSVLFMAFEKVIPAVIESFKKFSWEARVALVRGERIYLNSGRLSGLQVGDLLRVVEPEDEVFDPQTDQFIGRIKGRIKGTVEVMSYYGKDGSITRIHSGSGFKENDLVEFY